MADKEPNPIPLEQTADTQAVLDHVLLGQPLDPEIYRRIRARAEKMTEEIRRTQGVQNIAVDLVREIRDEE
jgi:predicted thioredoxin/glutaredoxin